MATPVPLHIVVDDREQDEKLLEVLHKKSIVERKRLSVGDYCVDDSVLFERKSASDFARSLIDGRLFSQASRLLQAPERPAYILQGLPAEWRKTGTRREALQGAIITLMLIFDIPLFRANDSEECARILLYTGRQMVRLRTGGDQVYRRVKAKRKATRQRRILQSLPGVGPERAKNLLKRFGSVEACIQATLEELSTVEGIGQKTAETIRNTVSEDPSNYAAADSFPLF